MGNRKNQNKGRGKRKNRKNSSQTKSNSQNETSTRKDTPPQKQIQPIITTTTKQEKKKPWYLSSLMKTLYIGIIGSVLAGIPYYFIQSCESKKANIKLIENQNKNADEIKVPFGNMQNAISELKKNAQETQKLLKQPSSKEEYERFKAEFQNNFEMFKDSVRMFLDSAMMKTKIDSQNTIVKNIAYVNATEWSDIFEFGYSVFRIGADKKLYPIQSSFSQKLKIDWKDARLSALNNSRINIISLNITEPIHDRIFAFNEISFRRDLLGLNILRQSSFYSIGDIDVYLGLISDNEEGIIGIIGFANNKNDYNDKRIIDYDEFQRITKINIKSPSNN